MKKVSILSLHLGYGGIEVAISNLANMLIDNYDVDGIECYHSIFNLEQIDLVKEFCQSQKLLMSGGSDYHGLHKPGIELGSGKGQLSIPDDIFKKIVEK